MSCVLQHADLGPEQIPGRFRGGAKRLRRYCRDCDLLIASKAAIEHLLTEMFRRHDPEAIGNDYLIIGTVNRASWREGLAQPKGIDDMLPDVSDFATCYEELRLTRPGYYRADQQPPVMEPPASQEWVKARIASSGTRAD
jgi:hypothetical protein